MILTLIGLIGAICFGAACIPMAWTAWRTGRVIGIPVASIWLFTTACVTYFSYLWVSFGFHLPFVIGIVETACWGIVVRYHYWPRQSKYVFDYFGLCRNCSHGPQSWPWWRWISFDFVKLGIPKDSPCEGWRLWVYLRSGWAPSFDFIIDRRGLA